MKHFRKVLIVFFCIVFIVSTCVIPSSACGCNPSYFMYDTLYEREYYNNNATYCYQLKSYWTVYCRNCGDQWTIVGTYEDIEHVFEYGRCVECGYLQ